mgnify:CR=1 FL=1
MDCIGVADGAVAASDAPREADRPCDNRNSVANTPPIQLTKRSRARKGEEGGDGVVRRVSIDANSVQEGTGGI